jgi:hypothetical protein
MGAVEKVIDAVNALQGGKATIDGTLQDIKRFILPNQANIQQKSSPGDTTDKTKRFDDTAPESVARLAGGLQGSLTPSTSQWNQLAFSDPILKQDKGARDWLDDSSERQHKAFGDSNFGSRINEAFLQIAGFGTTSVMTEERPKRFDGGFGGLQFDTYAISDYVFTEGADGRPNGLYRLLRLTAHQAKALFTNLPRFKGLGKSIEAALDKPKKLAEQFAVIHAMIPRDVFGGGGSLELPIASMYVAMKDKFMISEGGFHELPVATARWDRNIEDQGWGRGPGWVALPTIKSLNAAEKLVLQALAKDISPPLTVPNKSVAGGIRTTPNAIIYYDTRRAKGQKPEYLNSGTRWDVNQLEREEKRNIIRRIFFNHLLELPTDGPQMTLGESERRFQLLTRDMVGVFERIIFELLSPIVLRGFAIMLRADAFADMPGSIIEHINRTGGLNVDVIYTGPLARSLQREKVASIEQTYGMANLISEAKGGDPAPFDLLDDDAAMRVAHEQSGAPSIILRGKTQVEQIRSNRQQRQAQAIEAENLKTLAKAGKDAASAAAT